MIKRVIEIKKDIDCDDEVELSWFDMQKPNLTAVSNKGVNFIVKAKFTHLHENDILVSEDGYAIKVKRSEDNIYILEFKDALNFAKVAYEVGNRHQPVMIEDLKIVVLDDISLSDIVENAYKNSEINITKTTGYFKANGKAHHSH
ncbi:urease accessory protein UreE [Poseidonibacter ostreae]|jgi:urease accessory protein|uniref:Urease accessory protein UreE n=1 Tax=Poseidonibacter ostreae TaxID=2654171 RepID=A0A6L4WSB4_9BACT|nr:urease accessory protein UreE [Poseidonibacter ostreae]KAB7884264.1 urease accessory protein UreE [Poseidonibacter ostreae]KAB7887175.1 urease accessory protein UreE [Poseidonibacter ostreae]KAB7888144.1 urease accessory protein UreE [Poseidonibacter ostreae]MAC82973.1 urease accessory protein UreE [Arcobacter sp.]|tara:strand:+ start:2142 stop:2576 length:435 start_codon:yes stop_codon:yes gene_type:complete